MDGGDDGCGRCADDDRMCSCGGSAGAVVGEGRAAVRRVLHAMPSMLLRERRGEKWEAGNDEYV